MPRNSLKIDQCSESLIHAVRHIQKVRFISDTAFNDADKIGSETLTKREKNKTNTVRVNTTNKIKQTPIILTMTERRQQTKMTAT